MFNINDLTQIWNMLERKLLPKNEIYESITTKLKLEIYIYMR